MDIKELQRALPWGAHDYTAEFNARTDPARDFEHAHGHVGKALGGLFEHVIDAHAHAGTIDREKAIKKLADIVICAMRMANTMPGGVVDLDEAVRARLTEKFPAPAREGLLVWHPEEEGGMWFGVTDTDEAKRLYAMATHEECASCAHEYLGECGQELKTKPMTSAEYDALPEAP